MNCQRAQDCIDQYLDGTISDNDLEEFVYHIQECENCHEDLEIYYVVDMAKKVLGEGEEESYNICQLLERDIEKKLTKRRQRQQLKMILFFISVLLFGLSISAVCVLLGYL